MKHSHYFKDVSTLEFIDVYRILDLYRVTDNAIGHAIKKLLCAGDRGAKSLDTDIQEAIDTLQRWQAIRAEDMATVEPDTRVKPWEEPDYCQSERYEMTGDMPHDDAWRKANVKCLHLAWHTFNSLHYEQCTACGFQRPLAGA